MQFLAVFSLALLQAISGQGFSSSFMNDFFSGSSFDVSNFGGLSSEKRSSSGSDSSSSDQVVMSTGGSGPSSSLFSKNLFEGLSLGSDFGSPSRSFSKPRSSIQDLFNFDSSSSSSSEDSDDKVIKVTEKGSKRGNGDRIVMPSSSSEKGVSMWTKPSSSFSQPSYSYSEPAPSDSTPSYGSGSSGNSWVDAHNNRRRRHCVPDVSWSSSVAASAQRHADNLAYSCSFQHSSSGYGENLFMGTGSYDPDYVLSKWYDDEKRYYSYSSPGFSSGTGHFTQVVWKSTTEIGCGVSQSSCGSQIVVCQYSPAGNYQGRFGENVPSECA